MLRCRARPFQSRAKARRLRGPCESAWKARANGETHPRPHGARRAPAPWKIRHCAIPQVPRTSRGASHNRPAAQSARQSPHQRPIAAPAHPRRAHRRWAPAHSPPWPRPAAAVPPPRAAAAWARPPATDAARCGRVPRRERRHWAGSGGRAGSLLAPSWAREAPPGKPYSLARLAVTPSVRWADGPLRPAYRCLQQHPLPHRFSRLSHGRCAGGLHHAGFSPRADLSPARFSF